VMEGLTRVWKQCQWSRRIKWFKSFDPSGFCSHSVGYNCSDSNQSVQPKRPWSFWASRKWLL